MYFSVFGLFSFRACVCVSALCTGAEEVMLLAAHAFGAQHPWARRVRVAVNLEAAGSRGKSFVLQVCLLRLWFCYSVVMGRMSVSSPVVSHVKNYRICRHV